jgi:hypothetical protein
MRFWRLTAPDYRSDYEYSYINGGLEHPFGLPGVECDVCGQTWGGSRVLPYEYPESLRRHKKAKDRWPVPRSEHSALQEQLLSQLGLAGAPFVDLRPGDSFQPCYLETSHHVLVPISYGHGLAFSSYLSESGSRWLVCALTRLPFGRSRCERSESEDIIHEVPLLSDKASVGPYYEILPLKESDVPRNRPVKGVCSGCHREDLKVVYSVDVNMADELWRGDSVFYLATTLYIIVTNDIKEALTRIHPNNVNFVDPA